MTQKKQLQHIKEQFYAELTSLSTDLDIYTKVFPIEVIQGLPCFKPCDKKCRNDFLQFSIRLSASLTASDNVAATLSSLMIDADSINDNELIVFCADILAAYETYKASVCQFLDDGYNMLNTKDEVPLSLLFHKNQILTTAMITFRGHLEQTE